ncbi:MAG: hypothetical protein KDN22_28080 [Verrucomicrobiae bacterium]|nr:hypothetical protein [Verrucomicrobiae bacterium]
MDQSESLDLSQLHLTPDWVKQAPETNKYADYKGDDRESRGGRDRRGGFGGGSGFGGGGQGRGPRREAGGGGGPRKQSGDRRDDGGAPRGRAPGAPGPGGAGGQARRPDQGQGRRPGGNRDPRGGGNRDRRGGKGGDFRGGGRGRDDRFREPLPAGVEARFLAETAGVESLARQIKATGRAYSVFDLAKLVLSARERYTVEFVRTKDAPESTRFFQCKLDNSLWLSKEDALRHAMNSEGLAEYYTVEEVETEGPKGNFSVVAVCGMSGVLLGPPNHHDYQRDLVQLHQERFANMHIEGFKRRIRMEKDEAIIEQWKAQKSKETHYTYQKAPEGTEPVVLKSAAEMERHCREHHLDDFVVAVDSAKVPGSIPAKNLAAPLLAVLRNELEQQKRFPMNTVKTLCRQLEDQGLKFFKDEDDKKKKTTYVCRSRPRALQSASGLSDRIRRIVGLVRDNPGIDYAIVVSSMLPGQKLSAATTDAAKKSTHKGEKKGDAPKKVESQVKADATPVPAAEAQPSVDSPAVEPNIDPTTAATPIIEPAAPVESEAPASEVPNEETAPPAEVAAEAVAATAPVAEETAPVVEETMESPAPVSETPIPPAEETPAAESTEQPATEPEPATATAEVAAPSEAPIGASTTAAPTPEIDGPSEDEIGILKDLRWLIREGYVVEYSSGAMRLARNAAQRKRPAKKKKAAAPAAPATDAKATAPAADASASGTEAVAPPTPGEPADQSPAPAVDEATSTPVPESKPESTEAPAEVVEQPAPAQVAEALTTRPAAATPASEEAAAPAPPAAEPPPESPQDPGVDDAKS